MENKRLTKIIQVLSVILLATMVGAYLWSLFSRKEDKDLQAHNDWHRQQLDEMARANDLKERELETLTAIEKKAGKSGNVMVSPPNHTPPATAAPRKNSPTGNKKRKQNQPQPQGKKAETTPAAAVAGS